ncbi:unnamed protein product [Rotaria sp. Silwood2]|nr:unnamed protein product [Rotaria sp. Silwood2]CAF2581147.1 unnamed protein product [Rotaria sp. Silwood2]CAF2840489.1 unnamed protein product [Rotaria sp. Silwood2]CAF3012358.1 unnamed protein product [Rotaria sp. Silwood2]CAF3873039.1 unnamed protein product [Rotaria sp. Silwood2]
MQSRSPIGFEGLLSNEKRPHIGFEQYEDEPKEHVMPVYPLNDTMPNLNQPLGNNFIDSNYLSSSAQPMPSSLHLSKQNTNSSTSTKKSLSYPQLFAIYNEIVNEWSQVEWLIFVDNHKETYLTLYTNTKEYITVQMAISQYNLKSGTTLLVSLPECLLIRTKSKSKSLFLPNSNISIDNLLENNISQQLFRYKLLAILCDSSETNSKLMFYKDKQSNNWYVYYNQSILSPSHSNILSNDEQFQLESFVQQNNEINHIDLSKFTSPLSALLTHPIIYVYIPEKN